MSELVVDGVDNPLLITDAVGKRATTDTSGVFPHSAAPRPLFAAHAAIGPLCRCERKNGVLPMKNLKAEAQAEVVVPVCRRVAAPARHAAVPRDVVPAAAADHAVRASCGACGVRLGR